MKISVNKWNDYNPRKELKSMTWFRINADIGYSEALFKLKPDQKWLWIFILSTCARKNTGDISVDIEFFEHNSGVSAKLIESYIQVFEKRGLVTVTNEPDTNPIENGLYIQTDITNITNKHNRQTSELLAFWNSKNIIVHKNNDATLKKIEKAFKKRSESFDYVCRAIESYSDILHDSCFIWSHVWTLWEFLQRENADKFYPDEFSISRFPTSGANKAQQTQDKMLSMLREE